MSIPYPSSAYYPYLFDRDGDGDSDVYLAANPYASASSNLYDIVLDNAGGTFTPVATVPGTGYAAAIKAADLDGDGDQDILVGHQVYQGTASLPPMYLVRNLGAAGFAAPTTIGTSRATYSLEVGDFDGNGWLDVFQANSIQTTSSGQFSDPCVLYLNTGGANFTAVTQTFSGQFTAAGDLNNDGLTDLVVDWHVLFSGGGGTFIAGPPLPINPLTTNPETLQAPAVLVDVDLDGDLDLVQTPARVMLNLGGGTFGPWSAIIGQVGYGGPSFGDPSSAVVDLDHDGDPDIVAPGPIIVTNVMRQIARGSLARLGRPASIDLYGTPAASWMLYCLERDRFIRVAALRKRPHPPSLGVPGRDWRVHPRSESRHRERRRDRAERPVARRLDQLLAGRRHDCAEDHEPAHDHGPDLLRLLPCAHANLGHRSHRVSRDRRHRRRRDHRQEEEGRAAGPVSGAALRPVTCSSRSPDLRDRRRARACRTRSSSSPRSATAATHP